MTCLPVRLTLTPMTSPALTVVSVPTLTLVTFPQVSRRIVKKSLQMFEDIQEKGGEDWATFQKNFGKYLKVGVVEDKDSREDIADFITFQVCNDV
eukprot:3818398-Rhodomonas_salina.2